MSLEHLPLARAKQKEKQQKEESPTQLKAFLGHSLAAFRPSFELTIGADYNLGPIEHRKPQVSTSVTSNG